MIWFHGVCKCEMHEVKIFGFAPFCLYLGDVNSTETYLFNQNGEQEAFYTQSVEF